jgi:hypothetical protein
MLYSNHGNAREQKSTTLQAALKAACGCGATCLFGENQPAAEWSVDEREALVPIAGRKQQSLR